jgi:CheY-like chemotaxis protein
MGFTPLPFRLREARLITVTPRILIVDDSEHFRRSARGLLTARGLEVIGEAADGDEALELVRADPPDGVLLDVNMPGRDGFQVAALLREACEGLIILLTSSELDQAPESAAAAFVPKQDLALADLAGLFAQPCR